MRGFEGAGSAFAEASTDRSRIEDFKFWISRGFRVIGRRGIADFGQLESGPGALASKGDVGINDGKFAGFGNRQEC